ncbi:response regulator transcription factor [Microvirga sp. 3-52]|uniref:LuxR C-terminal-related transcriptional regulator n=1 Tax=Microvirga sp. 3-52 TaxID=2792425 RepID=UPI001ACAAE40|nr:response regulator transcription factor [Microvirga sp. 3-52]MBO1908978.1 response regulator transcription factor [Microvirga sp. 3-52]MBS7453471.1 response regulator transcription factor [Microvirga sp. 3-52]
MSVRTRVGLIADDDGYFRVAASAILTRHFGFSEIVEVESFDEALEYLGEAEQIEIALFVSSMSGSETPTNLRALREYFPKTRIVLISPSRARQDILSALEAGVHGYILKSSPVADLVKALNIVFDGGIYVPPCLAEIAPEEENASGQTQERSKAPDPAAKHTAPTNSLTSRQKDVLDLLVQGKTNKEIAVALNLGEGTVKIHMAAILRYFGVNNRAAAVVAAARPYPNRPRGVLNG